MLKKDYVLNEILQLFKEGKTITDVHEWLGIDETVLMAIQEVYETGDKWGQALTDKDIIEFYKSGLTFSEVSWVKGVTKEAIRLTLDVNLGSGKALAKEVSKKERNELKEKILYKMVVEAKDELGEDEAIKKTGYSKTVFRRIYKESVRWKELQEGSVDVDESSMQ